MSSNIKNKLESIFAIDSYETSEEGAPFDTVKMTNKKTGEKTNLIKDDPIYESDDPSVNDNQTLCIDFDGVIHKYTGWNNGQLNPDAIEGAKEAIDQLKNKYKIVIFSTRASDKYNRKPTSKELIENMKQWLNQHNIHYDDITAEKIGAVAYIDDRAIRFEQNWNDILGWLID